MSTIDYEKIIAEIHLTDEDLTTRVIDGDGTFDKLLTTMTTHINEQFREGRLVGTEYANVYLGSVTAVLQQAVFFLLNRDKFYVDNLLSLKQIELAEKELLIKEQELEQAKKQNELADAQIKLILQKVKTEKAQTEPLIDGKPIDGLVGSQLKLYDKQRQSFDRDAEVKLLKTVLDTWITRKTTDEGTPLPKGIDTAGLDSIISLSVDGVKGQVNSR